MSKDEKKLDITITRNSKDLRRFMSLVPDREKRIKEAPSDPIIKDPINDLARKLHPERQYLVIDNIKDETKTTKTIRLIPDPDSETKELAFFRAGQYLSLKVEVNGVLITRPYSISSSPKDALKGFYEITIREEEDGFLTTFIWKNWNVGTKVVSSGPEGFFYHDNIRDLNEIVGIGGGSGITPFRSMAKAIIEGALDAKITILYGSSNEEDIIFYDELKELENNNPDKLKVVYVLSCEEITLEGCEKGFISSEIIQKYVAVEECSFFVCGPQVMYEFIDKEMEKLKIPLKRYRKEAFGEIKNIVDFPGYPTEMIGKTFNIKVHMEDITKEVPALANESVLVALERANLAPPSKCRSGECGYCRSLLISGDVFISPVNDGRRKADEKFNFFHPCSSYPLSDLEINIPKEI